jgi:hypothetical protein
LLDIVRTDLTRMGFPSSACIALNEHEAAYKNHDQTAPGWSEELDDPAWYNAAANYLGATEKALQCKLKACSHVLLDPEASEGMEKEALQALLDPNDTIAMEHGVALVVKNDSLLEKYAHQLEEVSKSSSLARLSLNLKGAGMTGAVPTVLLRICAKAEFFDLSENRFDYTSEGLMGYTYLRHIIEHTHNMRDTKLLVMHSDEVTDLDGVS